MNRILIIEDETVIRTALRRLLERHGYEVAEAGSVAEAEGGQELASFDLVIADLRLPGAPGTDIIARCDGTPVLIMTSYGSVKSAVESMKLGAIDYIAKPFDHDELILTVQRILDGHVHLAVVRPRERRTEPAAVQRARIVHAVDMHHRHRA